MSELIVNRTIPPEAFESLHAALKTSLGSKLAGLTGGKGKVRVLLAPDATTADQNTAQQMVLNHDANLRTASQIKAAQINADFQEVVDTNASTLLQQITGDLAALPGADNAATKQIITRILQREQAIVKAFQYVSSL